MFAAIIMRGTRNVPQEFASGDALLGALMPYTQADVTGVWQDERAIIAQATWHNTPESLNEKAPEVCAETGRVIASWIRLDNRKELCAALRLEQRPTLTDPQIVLAAHRKWGSGCADRFEGDFSFIIYDPLLHETYCARDSIGAKPFFYHLTDSHFIVATSVAAIRAVKGLVLSPNLEWTALFLAVLNFAHTQAAYDDVKKLPPAHDLKIQIESVRGPREYFQFDLSAPHAVQRDEKWVEQYRKTFDNAVDVRARSAFLIGSESSAGLDSSSIAATLVKTLPHSLDDFHCFGMCALEHEPELLLSTAAKCGIRHSHILMKPEMLRIDDSFHRALKSLGHPPEHWQMLYLSSFFEQSQSLGIRTLFSGYGGDEVVTSYAKYLTAELLERKAYGAVWNEMAGPLPKRLARFGKFMLKGPPDPHATLRKFNARHFAQSCIRRDVLEDGGLAEKIEQWSFPDTSNSKLNTLVANSSSFRLARTGRLESEAVFAASYGIDYRYPMYDRALLQQFFATPSIEKRRRSMGRYLHRRAMQGRIPERILWQQTKFMGKPLGGSLNTQTYKSMAFGDLPELLRSIIDEKAYSQQQDAQRNLDNNTSESAIRRNMFFFQLRQLSTWLNSEAYS